MTYNSFNSPIHYISFGYKRLPITFKNYYYELEFGNMLYHFSENPNIEVFQPRNYPNYPNMASMVWAIDEGHAPIYFLPRGCPRVCFWPTACSNLKDIEYYQAETSANKVIVVESNWHKRIMETKLYQYSLPDEFFKLFDEGAGYFISHSTIIPIKVEPMGDLIQKLLEANVELRFTPSLKPLREKLLTATYHFSMIRLRNAEL